MKKSGFEKHFGFLRHVNELRFKRWLDSYAYHFLEEIGVKPGQIALDFGCGSGAFTIPAAEIVNISGLVYALDTSVKALNRIQKKTKKYNLDNIKIIYSKGEANIDLEDESLDHILLIDVLQEIDDKKTLLNEAYRVLKEGGLITIYPMHISEGSIIDLANKSRFILKEKKFDDHILVFSKPNSNELKDN